MHAVIRRDHLADPIRQGEAVQRLGEGLLPALNEGSDCVAAYVVAAADGSVVCLSLHADPDGAAAAAAQLAAWVEHHLAELVVAPARVAVGPVWAGPGAAPGRPP
jgi:hypothetical protein